MCKANDTMMSKVRDYLEHKAMIEELTAEMDSISDEIKAYMVGNEADEMQAGSSIVSYKEVTSKRVDTTALKKLLGDALDPYFKIVTSKRFMVK